MFAVRFICHLLLLSVLLCSGMAGADEYDVELLNENDGFSSSIIFSIAQDQQGFLWFGTAYDGVLRYDGKNVVNYRREQPQPFYIPHNNSGNLAIDHDGDIWVGGWGSGLTHMSPALHQAENFVYDRADLASVSDAYVQSVFVDADNDIWVGTLTSGLNLFNRATKTFTRFPGSVISSEGTSSVRIWDMLQTSPDEIWIGSDNGLNKVRKSTLTFEYYRPSTSTKPDAENKVRHLLATDDGRIVLGTHDGVTLFNPQTRKFMRLYAENEETLGPVQALLKTHFDQYWVSSGYGVYSFTLQDPVLRKVPLNFDDSCAQALFEDRQNNIWLSCEGQGIYKISRQTSFKLINDPRLRRDSRLKATYSVLVRDDENVLFGTSSAGILNWHKPTNTISDFANVDAMQDLSVHRMAIAPNGTLWFTNKTHLYYLTEDGKPVKYEPPPGSMHPEMLTSIIHLHFTPQGKFWIATRLGIFLMLAPDKPLLHVQAEPKNPLSLPVDTIVELYQDRQGRMWVGTENGVCVETDIFGEFRCFYVDGKRNSGSSMNYIYSIFQDDRDKIWVGTRTGLYQLNEQNGTFTEYGQQILSDNFGVHFIKGDAAGNLWLISHTGVIKFYPDSSEVEVFDKSDGLSGSRYYVNLVAQSRDGTIYLSSRDGIHYFNPSLVQERELNSPTVLTNFELIGQRNVRDETILPSNNIQLAPDQNYIKFEFSTLDLNSARRIRYYYKLEGLDDEWLDNGNSNAVMYTNLSGGDYVFRVRPALKNNLYYENELAVKLTIGTPFWLTGWMFGVYAILGLLLVQAYIHFRHRINQAEIERQRLFVSQLESQVAEKTEAIREESRKLALANRVKSEFLANMSHEIRTPLTSVIGHAEAIIHGDVEESSIKQEVARIHNHSRHLLALLNDILDVTRIEQNKLELEPHEQDIQALLTDVRDMFTSQAEAKGLTFRMISQLPGKLVAHVDGLRLKQVLINLCSNALKFTQQGSVDVIVSLQDNRLLFNVVDTGIGMTEEHQKRIFETFSQGDSSINRRFGGSGLGLALSRQLVNLMDGELRVTSAPNKGSIFTFSIPLTLVEHASELPSISPSQALPELSGCVLLAEDHPDNRRLIERLLKRLGLRVLAAQNGFEAIELYVNHQPDVVLLDIQMPQKDGLQTFRELRELGCTKPIVAITANAMVSDIKHYRAIGFNGYLRKPIEREQMVALMLELFSSGLDQAQMVRQLNEVDTSDLQQTFVSRLETEKNQLSALLDQQNWQVIAQLAHRLAGSAQFFGFRLISEKAIEVEMAVKDGHLDTLPELVRQLLDTLTSAENSARE